MLLINGLPNRVNICQRATDGFRSANEHIMWTGSLGARIDWNTLKYTHNNNNNPQHIHTHIEKWPKSGSKWINNLLCGSRQTNIPLLAMFQVNAWEKGRQHEYICVRSWIVRRMKRTHHFSQIPAFWYRKQMSCGLFKAIAIRMKLKYVGTKGLTVELKGNPAI